MSPHVAPAPQRGAGSLPFPDKRAGEADKTMPFEHIVVVMMENHSFDNLLGALRLENAHVEGLTFEDGMAINENAGTATVPGPVRSFALANTAQGKNVTQSWKATHE